MASKTTGRLAGLAALGAAAYLYNKDKTKDPVKGDSKPVTENKPVTEKPRNFADVSNDQDRQMAIDAGPSLGKLLDEKYVAEDERPAPTGMGAATKMVAPTFGKAFREARDAGNKTFMFNNKKYTTDLAKPAAPTASGVSVGTGSGGGRGPAAGEEAAYKARNSDGGKSMIDRQNAAAKKSGLSVEDYYASNKSTVDKQEGVFKRGGKVKKMASGGMTSKRGDGIASKGRTRCKMY